jgi:hypothetical protein
MSGGEFIKSEKPNGFYYRVSAAGPGHRPARPDGHKTTIAEAIEHFRTTAIEILMFRDVILRWRGVDLAVTGYEDGVLRATGVRHEKAHLDWPSDEPVPLGASGLPLCGVVEPVTIIDWRGPPSTPCAESRVGHRLVLDLLDTTVGITTRSER